MHAFVRAERAGQRQGAPAACAVTLGEGERCVACAPPLDWLIAGAGRRAGDPRAGHARRLPLCARGARSTAGHWRARGRWRRQREHRGAVPARRRVSTRRRNHVVPLWAARYCAAPTKIFNHCCVATVLRPVVVQRTKGATANREDEKFAYVILEKREPSEPAADASSMSISRIIRPPSKRCTRWRYGLALTPTHSRPRYAARVPTGRHCWRKDAAFCAVRSPFDVLFFFFLPLAHCGCALAWQRTVSVRHIAGSFVHAPCGSRRYTSARKSGWGDSIVDLPVPPPQSTTTATTPKNEN